MTDGPTLEEEGAVAAEFLDGLAGAFGVSASVERRMIDDDTVEVAMYGDDLGLLIGPRGQTLAAIQDLTRTVVQRRLGGRSGRLLVDVADYRQKRRASLERFTREIAERVRTSGVATTLEPMAPPDRKVVHDTVNTIEGVATISEGEEPSRRVVIMPEADTPA